MRTNSRPSARATDSPIEVLPVPGGPTRVRIAPDFLSGSIPRSVAQLAHGQVLDDAVLDVVEAGVVGVEDLARVRGIQALLGALRPRHRHEPVEVRADHRGLAARLAHPLQPVELALGLLADGVGHVGLGDLRPVLLDHRRVVVAELLADRLQLLAQHVLALLPLGVVLDVVADALAHLELGEPLALQAQGQLEPLDHVDGLEQLDLLLEGEVGRVARGVGQRARLADRAHERRHAAVVAAQLEDLLDDRAVLALELARLRGRRRLVGPLVDLDAQAARGVRLGGADDAAVQAGQRDGATAAGQADALADLGDGADLRVLALVPGHEQHALLVAGLGGQGDVHAGEDDEVVQWYEQQLAHRSHSPFRTRSNYKKCSYTYMLPARTIGSDEIWPTAGRTQAKEAGALATVDEPGVELHRQGGAVALGEPDRATQPAPLEQDAEDLLHVVLL